MADFQFSPFNVQHIVIGEEDPNGGLDLAGSVWWNSSPVSVDGSADITEGDSFEKKNGVGAVCCSANGCDTIKGASGSLTICNISGSLLAFLTGVDAYTDGVNDTGAAFPFGVQDCTRKFAMETYQQVCYNGATLPGFLRVLYSGISFTYAPGSMAAGFQDIIFNWKTTGGTIGGTRKGIFDDWDGLPSQLGGFWYDASGTPPPIAADEVVPVSSL